MKYLLIMCCLSTLAVAQKETLVIGKNYILKSSILKEDRPYSVYLPEGCEEGGKKAPCPVLYILDGNGHFHYASGILQRMSINQQIPDMIMNVLVFLMVSIVSFAFREVSA